jgi:hypothetical protein
VIVDHRLGASTIPSVRGEIGMASISVLIVLGAAISAIATTMLFGLWRLIRATCRRFRMADRSQSAVASASCLATVVLVVTLSADRLTGLERTCRSELSKAEIMHGATALRIEQHHDFWNKTVSGGSFVMPWVSEPYTDPKTVLVVQFVRNERLHKAWVECQFARVPDSGTPPAVTFQKLQVAWVNVLDERKRWVPLPRSTR